MSVTKKKLKSFLLSTSIRGVKINLTNWLDMELYRQLCFSFSSFVKYKSK